MVLFRSARLREVVRENERLRAYLNQRFPGFPVADDDARRYFEEHRDRFPGASFEGVRGAVLAELVSEQRHLRIADWVAGLRERSDITDLLLADP